MRKTSLAVKQGHAASGGKKTDRLADEGADSSPAMGMGRDSTAKNLRLRRFARFTFGGQFAAELLDPSDSVDLLVNTDGPRECG
jgi:hypothetical protein